MTVVAGSDRTRVRLRALRIAAAVPLVIGCAGNPLRSAALPAQPAFHVSRAAAVLALVGVPAGMADETRAIAASGGGGVRESTIPPAEALTAACAAEGERIFRPALSREHFASNVPDRNAFLIYESAVIVGLPVAAVSLAAWDWRGETTVDGVLEEFRCGDAAPTQHFASFRLETAGNGTMRVATLRDAQRDAALRALARKLFALVDSTPAGRDMEAP